MTSQLLHKPRPLLITRPAAQGAAFGAALEAAWPGRWAVVLAPMLEIVTRDAVPDLGGVSHLVFSSANGVAVFSEMSRERDLPVLCVGPQTAEAARVAGFAARQMGATAADLVAAVVADPGLAQASVLHLRGDVAAGDVAGDLRRAGRAAREEVIYDQVPVDLPAGVSGDLVARVIRDVALFSPRSAEMFSRAVRGLDIPEGLRVHCLSDAVAAAVRIFGVRVFRAGMPDRAAMIRLLGEDLE